MTKYFFVLIATITSSILFSSCKKEKSVLAEAKFTFSGDLVVIPSQIQFTNNSFGISYIWDFFFLPSVLDIAFPAYVYRVMGVSRERGLGGQLTIKLILINHFKNYLFLPY